jgi:hypothetical protein
LFAGITLIYELIEKMILSRIEPIEKECENLAGVVNLKASGIKKQVIGITQHKG